MGPGSGTPLLECESTHSPTNLPTHSPTLSHTHSLTLSFSSQWIALTDQAMDLEDIEMNAAASKER